MERSELTKIGHSRGPYFEEMVNGRKSESSGRTATEADIMLFAGLSGDDNPLHTNSEFARKTVFGQRVPHGFAGIGE
jgi:acyl dehydratase